MEILDDGIVMEDSIVVVVIVGRETATGVDEGGSPCCE